MKELGPIQFSTSNSATIKIKPVHGISNLFNYNPYKNLGIKKKHVCVSTKCS